MREKLKPSHSYKNPRLIIFSSTNGTKINVDPITHHFVDSSDKSVKLFHGFNSVVKHYPWYDPKLLDLSRQKSIVDMGFNVIR